jgi:SAM-dependent methyltransferase
MKLMLLIQVLDLIQLNHQKYILKVEKMKETHEAIKKYQGYAKNRFESMSPEYRRYMNEYVFHIHFNRKSNNGKTVDFGGSAGESTRRIDNLLVVEIDQQARDIMNKAGIPNLRNMDLLEDGSVDTIYSSHVLEHVENPFEQLKEFHRKLKPKGKLILVIPCESSVLGMESYDTNGHLFAWNKTTINTLLIRAGFTIESNEYATLGSSSKILGMNLYSKLIKNPFISRMARLISVLKCELLNKRTCGEYIIRCKKGEMN